MKSIWIAMHVDYGDTCDGKPRVLNICKTKEEAIAFVHNDIEKWANDHAGERLIVDFDKMTAYCLYDADVGCEWNIEEFSVES